MGQSPANGRTWRFRAARVAMKAVLVVAGMAVMLVVLERTVGSRRWIPGNCVGPSSSGDAYDTVGCESSQAAGKIIKMLQGPPRLLGEAPCPEETDATYDLALLFQTACVRNLKPPHPGDPGQGGGVVRVGDCLGSPTPSLNFREKPCADGDWYGKVVALVGEVTACPAASTVEAYELPGADGPSAWRVSGQGARS